jgi:hypothetical protein
MEERDLPASIQRDLFDKIAFSFPESEMSLAMPVPGHSGDTRPGHRRYYFIWYRPADAAALRDLCTDANGVHHLMSPRKRPAPCSRPISPPSSTARRSRCCRRSPIWNRRGSSSAASCCWGTPRSWRARMWPRA